MNVSHTNTNHGNGYKDAEVGTIPVDWEVAALGELGLRFHGGGTPSTKKSEYWNGNIAWTTSAYIDYGIFLEKCAGYITPLGLESSSTQFVPKHNLLIGTRVGVGKVAINLLDTAISQDLTAMIVDTSKADTIYLAYAIRWENTQKEILGASRGTTIKGIPRADLIRVTIPLPPLPEQRRIAAALNAIQEAIATQEDVIAAARAFKRSLMQRLFTYGPGQAPVETKDTLFGEVPASWQTVPLGECAYVQTGIAKGRRYSPGEKTREVPYLRVANVQDGYLDLSEIKTIEIKPSEFDRYRLELGDMLMTEGGDFDKLGRGFIWNGEVGDCVHQNHVFAVRADQARLMPEFLAYLSQSSYGKSYFLNVAHRTTNLASINSTKLKAFPVLLPPKEDQRTIVEHLRAVDTKIAAEEDRKTALQVFFKSMLYQLMTGQLRLLSDEGLPSSLLLLLED